MEDSDSSVVLPEVVLGLAIATTVTPALSNPSYVS
jgi:hypothetical protein